MTRPSRTGPSGTSLSSRAALLGAAVASVLALGLLASGCSGGPAAGASGSGPSGASRSGPAPGAATALALAEDADRALRAGRFAEAEARAAEAARRAGETGDSQASAAALFALGRARARQKRFDEALESFRQGEKVSRLASLPGDLARARAGQAGVLLLQGQQAEAKRLLESALAEAPDDVASTILTAMSALHLKAEDPDAAMEAAAEAVRRARKDDDRADALEGLAEVQREKGLSAEAKKSLFESMGIRTARGSQPEVAEAMERLGKIAAQEGDDDAAERYYSRAAKEYEAVGMSQEASSARKEADRYTRPAPTELERALR